VLDTFRHGSCVNAACSLSFFFFLFFVVFVDALFPGSTDPPLQHGHSKPLLIDVHVFLLDAFTVGFLSSFSFPFPFGLILFTLPRAAQDKALFETTVW